MTSGLKTATDAGLAGGLALMAYLKYAEVITSLIALLLAVFVGAIRARIVWREWRDANRKE